MPALDSLRGLAITANLCYHGLGGIYTRYAGLLTARECSFFSVFRYGYLGVHLFFTLSGFLITGILLDTRHRPDYFKQFYTRRVLRILPVFLLMVVLLKAMHQIGWAYLGFTVIFLSNFVLRMDGGANYQAFWTLSVEEQFYIFWPILIRRLRTRTCFALALALVLLGSPLRYAVGHLPPHFNDMFYKTWDVLDFFGGGAAMAIVIRSPRLRPHLRRIFVSTLGLGLFLLLLRGWLFPDASARTLLSDATTFTPVVFLFSASLLGGFLHPELAANRIGQALAFMGYISYGLYLCHPLIEQMVEKRWQLPATGGPAFLLQLSLRFFLFAGLAILAAWISRSTFEAYFLKLKPHSAKSNAIAR